MVIHPSDNVEIHDDGHKYARRAIAVRYGRLLSYSDEAIERYLNNNTERE